MKTPEQLDAFFGKTEEDVHPLEKAARLCMEVAKTQKTWNAALIAHNCAITIRNMPEWRMYR